MTDVVESLLSEKTCAEIDAWLKKFPEEQRRSATLYALRMAQEQHGWLSEPVMNAVADYLNIPPIQVYEVATFYSMYNLKPIGRHKLGVCTNISCMLCGSKKLVNHLKDKYSVGIGETTQDGQFTLQEVECLAACVGAPAVIVDDKHYHEKVSPEQLDAIISELE